MGLLLEISPMVSWDDSGLPMGVITEPWFLMSMSAA